jgi:hypothetical protein
LRDCKVEADFYLQWLHIGHGPSKKKKKKKGGLYTPADASRLQVAWHVPRGSGDIASRVAEHNKKKKKGGSGAVQ